MQMTTLQQRIAAWERTPFHWQTGGQCRCAPGVQTDCIHFCAHALGKEIIWPQYGGPFSEGKRGLLLDALDARPDLQRTWKLSDRLDEIGKPVIHHQRQEFRDGDLLVFKQGQTDAHPAVMFDAGKLLIAHCVYRRGVVIQPLDQPGLWPMLLAIYRERA
jgi:hypothetical protein